MCCCCILSADSGPSVVQPRGCGSISSNSSPNVTHNDRSLHEVCIDLRQDRKISRRCSSIVLLVGFSGNGLPSVCRHEDMVPTDRLDRSIERVNRHPHHRNIGRSLIQRVASKRNRETRAPVSFQDHVLECDPGQQNTFNPYPKY